VIIWDDEHMARVDRVDVHESRHHFVCIDDLRIGFGSYDVTKDTFGVALHYHRSPQTHNPTGVADFTMPASAFRTDTIQAPPGLAPADRPVENARSNITTR
jgi:hypothetical protein